MSLLLKAITAICHALFLLLRGLFFPMKILGKVVFSLILVNLYRAYLSLKSRTAAIWRPAKNKILFPLSSRYVVHGFLIVSTLFVTANSLKAREIKDEESWRPSMLSSLIKDQDAEEEIVVTAAELDVPGSAASRGIGGVSPIDMVEAENVAPVATTLDSSSLIKPAMTSTAEGDRPREDVVYHAVEGGETVSTIAEQYGISINTVLWENQLTSASTIKPGQKLTILPTSGVSHRVTNGETVSSIAKKYEAQEDAVITYNKLADASAISEGQVLIIPGGRVPPPPPVQPTTRLVSGSGGISTSDQAPAGIRAPAGGGLLWPTPSHKINQYYTYRHGGIDIDGVYTSPVYAAEAGRVTFVGWGGGYGLHVIIDHGNGMQTVYGHASKTFVSQGQRLEKGQTIMMQGCTGWCTGVHLHFEVHINGRRVNPFSYL